jgi:hypothetical protein
MMALGVVGIIFLGVVVTAAVGAVLYLTLRGGKGEGGD